MGCCFSSHDSGNEWKEPMEMSQITPDELAEPVESAPLDMVQSNVTAGAPPNEMISNHGPERPIRCKEFNFTEVYSATDGFGVDRLLGQGGFGPVYKGFLNGTNQEVAIKRFDLQGQQGNREFLTEVMMLSKLHHPNLVKLVGCCVDHGQRILVYEYMPLGSLNSRIHGRHPGQQPLDWSTRIKILLGAAKGLEHLHDKIDPPVINRDVKCANILLGEGYHPKLSDFGLAKLGPTGDDTHISTRIMGTPGYCAPEYLMSGKLTIKSDIYSFGVVMLEVLTGRTVKDDSRAEPSERNLALWAATLSNKKDLTRLADPALQGQYPPDYMYRVLAIAALCVDEEPRKRPKIGEIVVALTNISRSRRRSNRERPSTSTGTSSGRNQAQDQGEGS